MSQKVSAMEPKLAAATADEGNYQSGFGNEFATEALPGVLPEGRNSPQKVPASALWSVYSAFSTDYGRSFTEYRTTPPMQKGPICTSGTGCPTGSRNLLDFFETAADEQGCLVTTYADNNSGTSGAIVSYVRQTSGPGLRSAACR